MAKLGIDAKWFFNGPASGKVVVVNLLEQLIKVNKTNQLFIFLDKKFKKIHFPFKDQNIKLIYIWSRINLFSNLFIIPYYAKILGIDVVLFQNFPALFSKCKNVLFIHDVLFLSNPEYYTLRERIYFSPLKYLVPKSSLIFTVSEEEKRRILKYYNINSNSIKVIYHGVNNIFKPIQQFPADLINNVKRLNNLPENYLLYVGRLNIRKNILKSYKSPSFS